ncbi:uncharacterized protein N7458_003153 [Penicillium daleae]|uniref:Uncharacterized protein n=1 Tax=Penicillium daleae TaxID=63821 RepID=A0AAD6G6X4_9EURO|nr:uncharacterized protein N7458_003153 [Penicillium daleae]KAJ5461601.1 hypothetical protein N7458_003153 [Penicillium daleae]
MQYLRIHPSIAYSPETRMILWEIDFCSNRLAHLISIGGRMTGRSYYLGQTRRDDQGDVV